MYETTHFHVSEARYREERLYRRCKGQPTRREADTVDSDLNAKRLLTALRSTVQLLSMATFTPGSSLTILSHPLLP